MVGKKKATFGEKVVGAFLAGVAHAGVVFYGQELAGIAKVSGTYLSPPLFGPRLTTDRRCERPAGLPLGQLVLLQLVYEASAACTSIIVPQDPTEVAHPQLPQHFRTGGDDGDG